MPTIRELIHKVVFQTDGREQLVRANDAIDDAADNSRRAARQATRFDRALTGVIRRARTGIRSLGGLARAAGRFAAVGLPIIGGAAVGVLAALTATGISAAASIDRIGKAAETLGISVGEFDALTQAADLADISFEQTETSIRRLLRSASDAERGLSTPRDAFKALGVSVTNSNGEIKTASELLVEIAGGLEAIPSQARRVQIAMDIFGRSGADVLRLLQNGAQSFQAELDSVSAAGLLTQEDADRAAAFNDSITEMRARFRRVRDLVGATLFPTLTRGFERVSDFIVENIDRVEEFAQSLSDGITAFFEGDGPERINEGLKDTLSIFQDIAKIVKQLIDLLTTDDVDREIQVIRAERNEAFNRQGVQGQVRGTIANIQASRTGFDRQLAEQRVAARTALTARTAPNAAFLNSLTPRGNTEVNVQAPVTVNVTEGNAERAGRSFGRGVVDGSINASTSSDAQSAYGN